MNTKKTDNDSIIETEVQRQRALRRLGANNPVCCICGEDDPRVLERHHLAGRAYADSTVILCRNCHDKQSNPGNNSKAPSDPSIMERLGHLLVGLAAFFEALIETLRRFGQALIEGASHCPAPWGSGARS